jgi:hypothetical protein
MSTIKNLELLADILDANELEKLDTLAFLHQKQSNIEFTVRSLEDDILTVEAEQGKTSGKYANFKTLIKRAGEVFNKSLPSGVQLHVIPQEYMESPAMVVSPEWIARKMVEKEVRIKQIAFDTGIERKDISDWISGERSMSQIVKAMFYFYFNGLK